MAQPVKIGLDYFPLNVDIFDDEKVMAISKEFGIKGEIVVIRLLCAIYRNGYFIEWNELLRNKLQMNMPGVSSELLDTIVQRLVRWDFFDKSLFYSTAQVLTSRGIQKRYFNAVKRRKTPSDLPYLIVGDSDNSKVSTVDKPQTDKPVRNVNLQPQPVQQNQEEVWYQDIRKDQLFLETVAMRFHMTIEAVQRGIDDLNLENKAKEKTHTDYKDYRQHAFDYLRYWVQNNNKAKENKNGNKAQQQIRRGGIETTPASQEDYKGSF